MYQGKETSKKYRMAKLHEMAVNARGRGLPGKLAELGALFIAIITGIAVAQDGRMAIVVLGNAIGMFILYSIFLQIFSRIIFLAISLITLPAYKIYTKRSKGNEWYQNYQEAHYEYHSESEQNKNQGKKRSKSNEWYQNHQNAHHEYHSESGQNKNHEQNRQYNQNTDSKRKDYNATRNTHGMTETEARALFSLNETFTSEELKKARNRELKKCHPDQNMTVGHTKTDEERAKKVNLAYEVLKNKAREKQTA